MAEAGAPVADALATANPVTAAVSIAKGETPTGRKMSDEERIEEVGWWGIGTIAKVGKAGKALWGTIWSSKKNLNRFENALEHWRKHRKDFPSLSNAEEYVKTAHRFLNEPPTSALSKVRKNGDVVVYDPVSDLFGVRMSDGTPRTFFRPDPAEHGFPTNLDYFNDQ